MGGPPPGVSPPGGMSRQCKCGYTHPSPWDDKCPMVQGENLELDEKSQSITKFCTDLAKLLHSRNDYTTIIDAFRKRLKI